MTCSMANASTNYATFCKTPSKEHLRCMSWHKNNTSSVPQLQWSHSHVVVQVSPPRVWQHKALQAMQVLGFCRKYPVLLQLIGWMQVCMQLARTSEQDKQLSRLSEPAAGGIAVRMLLLEALNKMIVTCIFAMLVQDSLVPADLESSHSTF
eukprot:TRINITY_DN26505_c0_g1_i1.p1 TRINITY_DN26505_c0_g1~~TRINITY_DN26505_c0_g1_i1.p1  ORF type:complete len:151 (-),score=19.70 TRINITY_DN26505_c0_g1_i1:6-458(-)